MRARQPFPAARGPLQLWPIAVAVAVLPPHMGLLCGVLTVASPPTHTSYRYLEELQQHMKVDIYGCGLQKASEHKFGELPKGEAARLAFVAQYKFYLAFEETIASGVATAQLLSAPLVAGAIPVRHRTYTAPPPSVCLPSGSPL